ncbi:ubiquitin-like-conjugating enzyme ATG10 isoform X2 [Gordionus sp. m RMFG-2023]|uniref:ubiquitin-like-conjugating enzyme ATG10 isoform X2 n=1 Tax=Gordionus sp. m RMFG-2023 TaxID=3053472 RepID=UPI0031FC6405
MLSHEQFVKDIKEFYEYSKQIKDFTWDFININGTSYLKKVIFSYTKYNQKLVNKNNQILKWEYNILYDIIYQVPILYFNCCYENGILLNVHELLEQTPTPHKDHPILQIPYFYIHPCHTENIINIFKYEKARKNDTKSKNMVISWLTLFGQFVNLEIPNVYANL